MHMVKAISELRADLEQMRRSGQNGVNIAPLIDVLRNIEHGGFPSEKDKEHELFMAKLRVEENDIAFFNESALEMFRSVITTGQNAIRACLVLNGGAALAALTFLGHLLTSTQPRLYEKINDLLPTLACALLLFALGSLIATSISGLAYLSQWFYADNEQRPNRVKIGHRLNVVCIVLGFAAYGLFGSGVFLAAQALAQFKF